MSAEDTTIQTRLDEATTAAINGVQQRLSWASMHWGTDKVDPNAWPPLVTAAITAAGLPALLEQLDLVTCRICEELMIPGEDVLPEGDSWVHRDCAEAGE